MGDIKYSQIDKENIIKRYKNGEQLLLIAKDYNTCNTEIIRKLKDWGIFEYKNKRWTEEERNILKNVYPTGKWCDILEAIPNHNKDNITHKASELNIKREQYFWLENEIELLKEYYTNDIKPRSMVKYFDGKFSVGDICCKANKLGITKDKSWKDWEIQFLKDNYGKITVKEIQNTIKRHKQFIIQKANEMGLNSKLKNILGEGWTIDEDDFIKANYLELTDVEMSRAIEGRTWRSVKWRREKLGCERPVINNYGNGCINVEGIIFNSRDEMFVYEFIKSFNPMLKYIKSIGNNHKSKGKYVFELDSEWEYKKFYPDYVIEYIDMDNKKNKLLKPIVIEYYGMFNLNKNNNSIIDKYNKKTLAKEEFYKSRDDIYYIGIFPEDIKNNYDRLKKKLESFFMQNFSLKITY